MTLASIQSVYRRIRTPVAMCVGNRLALFVVVYLGLALDRDVSHPWRAFPKNLFLDGWFRWDTGWYMRIVERGYLFAPGEVQLPVNCFPLYPLLVRALAVLTGNAYVAGFVISNVALVMASILLYSLVRRRYGEVIATNTLGLLLCYPFSYYMSAMYTESLFLLEAVGVFYFAQRRSWLLASLCAAASSATKVVGCVTSVALLLAYLQYAHFRPREIRKSILWLGVAPAGLAAYMLFLYLRFGDPLAFYRAQWVPGWGGSFTFDGFKHVVLNAFHWSNFREGNFDSIPFVNIAFGALCILVCLVGFRHIGWVASLWGLLTMAVSLRIWGCAGRYSSVVWPAYLGLALAIGHRRILYQSVFTGFCLLQAVLAIKFTHGLPLY